MHDCQWKHVLMYPFLSTLLVDIAAEAPGVTEKPFYMLANSHSQPDDPIKLKRQREY